MKVLPSVRQLRYLVAISEHLNFSRAAECCFVTQSTLSSGLKELEEVLGTCLVERDRRKVLMTPLGSEMAKRARTVLAGLQDMAELAGNRARPMTGLLRLGVIPTVAPFILPRFIPLLRAHYPDLQLALREDLTVNLLSRLDDGRLDLALIALPYDAANLLVESLFDDDLWVVGHNENRLLQPAEIDLTPALTDQLLLLEEGHCLRDHTLYACGPSTGRSTEGLEATSLPTLVQMVESGLGIALVPEMAVKSDWIESSDLVVRPMKKPGPRRTIALVARRSTSRVVDFQALAEVLRIHGDSVLGRRIT